MCGICGFVSREDITLEQLKKMNDTMIKRGPNDSGEEIYMLRQGYSVGMAQRRLSILDLSPAGHQPMTSADQRVTVVYNGEMYNYMELKEELSDYPYRSTCDTEVILAAYLKWGIDFVDKIKGMFAIALYDRENGDMYLIRDRIGKKPLYYMLQDDNLIFGSELKPIMVSPGFDGQIRNDILSRYLYQQYINAPDTIFKNVYKLEPGTILKFSYGKITKKKYWDISEVYDRMSSDQIDDYDEAKSNLKELLRKAVSQRMIADVPLGTFLSGGFDSSLVTAIAQEASSEPVKTFSIGFNEERYNEAGFASDIAGYLGTDHTDIYIGEQDMLEMVRSIPQYFDEPFADSSQIPTMLVSKLARSKVTVVLSGDGGDEFYCGYNIYKKLGQAQKLDGIGGVVHSVAEALHLDSRLPFKVKAIADNRDPLYKTQMCSDIYLENASKMIRTTDRMIPLRYEGEGHYNVSDWQVRRMLLDMDTYLPGDILCKVDRASMKYSLEARCPILDTDVMEYSFRIPQRFKNDKGKMKYILKDIAYDYIPREKLDRPKKGFGVPLDKWLRGSLRNELMDYINEDYLNRQGLFDTKFTNDMIQGYLGKGDAGPSTGANLSRICWSYYVFQQWYQQYSRYIKRNGE